MSNSKAQGQLNNILQYFNNEEENEEEEEEDDQGYQSFKYQKYKLNNSDRYQYKKGSEGNYSQQNEEEKQQNEEAEEEENNQPNYQTFQIEDHNQSAYSQNGNDNEEYQEYQQEQKHLEHSYNRSSPRFANREEEEEQEHEENKLEDHNDDEIKFRKKNDDQIRFSKNNIQNILHPSIKEKNRQNETNNIKEQEDEDEEKRQKEIIREEMRKKEESLRSQLKKKEEELREGLKRQKEQEMQEKASKTSSQIINIEPSKRASILLRQIQKKELNLPENNDNKIILDKFNEEFPKEKYDELSQEEIVTSKNISSFFKPALYNDDEEFKFQPKINENSKRILLQKKNRLQLTPSNSSNFFGLTYRSKSPVEYTLYKDALRRQKKYENVKLNTDISIKLNASKTKISNNSHKIAITGLEKSIDQAVKKYSFNGRVNYMKIAQILTQLHIFRELLRDRETGNEVKKISELKETISKVRDYEKRKKEEINFLVQLWICLNPQNEDVIKSQIFAEFMKILFSPVESSVKEIASILRSFLQVALFLNNNNKNKNTDSTHKDSLTNSGIISPITDQLLSSQDIWSLENLVKHFLQLKANIIAYKKGNNTLKDNQKELNDDKRNSSNNKQKIKKNKDEGFNKKIRTFQESERLRLLALKELKKESEKAELDQCTFKPKINSNYYNNNNFTDSDHVPVYDKLYKQHKNVILKKEQERENKKKDIMDKEMENCTFKPNVHKKKINLSRSFEIKKMPRGFNEHVEHTRRGIIENLRKKYMIEKREFGENYERLKRMDIKPLNIIDIKRQEEKEYGNMMSKTGRSLHSEKEESDGDHDYFTMQIKIPNGKETTIKVYSNDDPEEVVDNFCRIYPLKVEIKKRLIANIINFQKQYLTAKEENDDD